MKKSNTISCSKNIFLDKNRMDELHAILLKHCKRVKIETKCVDSASIEFDSYDELMEYSNFNKGRIERLEITGYDDGIGWDRKIYFDISSEHPKGPSLDCTYYFTQTEEEAIFKQEIVDFLNKVARDYIQPRIGSGIVFLLFFIGFFHFSNTILSDNWFLRYLCAYISTQILLYLFNKFIWYKLFPMVSFSWGESVEYYKKIDKWKNGVFWSIIIAIPVAIIANYLFAMLKGG